MINIIPFCTLDTLCPYLKDRQSRTEYIFINGCDFALNSKLVKYGYRRFGRYFQKPICKDCKECISVRINSFEFKPSKSQRRVIRKNEKTKWIISKPIVDDEHIALFDKYHKHMYFKRDWQYYDIDLIKYYDLYVIGHGNFGKEISYYNEYDELICVDLIDVINDGISSIYCYYDPDYAHLSLGKFSLLKEIEIAKSLNLQWVYLGYYVKGCQSLEYKKEFMPQQKLEEYVGFNEIPNWS
ncbi:arginyltransferase [Campylobacter blaseri]|uniref:Aspartate/glutamate leucyltransferase n=1 Tax=Campylobacter blaseri TaxID=2042961 RepID=A0A2P8R2F8_9BACT|nr:arginyltransferase [Campylobacter blaseri]PSM52683.1 arginyltransferase [Campylobacter blaseri]PSM54331.1 arginyltransferase [Campylobacter blaseri]QKF85983.1 arginyltransferase [Campylobacter blaseri]